jgi:plasmid stability protein
MMQRTTVSISDDVLREVRRRAAKRGHGLGHEVDDLLRSALRPGPKDPATPAAEWKVHDLGAPLVDIFDRDALFDAMEER